MVGAGSETVKIEFWPLLAGRTLKGSIFGGLTIKTELPKVLEKCKNKVMSQAHLRISKIYIAAIALNSDFQ